MIRFSTVSKVYTRGARPALAGMEDGVDLEDGTLRSVERERVALVDDPFEHGDRLDSHRETLAPPARS